MIFPSMNFSFRDCDKQAESKLSSCKEEILERRFVQQLHIERLRALSRRVHEKQL